jgi:hypothetical protein
MRKHINHTQGGIVMKTVYLYAAFVVLSLLALSVSGFAGPDATKSRGLDHQNVAKNFIADLKIDNPGIVESALFVIVEYRNRYPALDYSSLIDELAKVARDQKDSTISYKAHLAMMYLRYGTDGDLVPSSDPGDHESLFRQIAEQLEKKFLASNISG